MARNLKNREGFGHELGSRIEETAAEAADKAREAGDTLGERVQDAAANMAESAQKVAAQVGEKADQAVGAVGSGVASLGRTIHEKGPQTGIVGNASCAVADTLESGGRYLERHGLSGLADDLADLIRHNPMPSVLVGLAAGFLIGRAIYRSR